MPKISHVYSREILDSRGIPTLETAVVLENGTTGIASVPSGTSVGTFEAHELRDGDKNRFLGKGVLKAINNAVNVIGPKIQGMESADQIALDKLLIQLDGTETKEKLGANSILSVSLANLRASAAAQNLAVYKWTAQISAPFGFAPKTLKVPTPIFNLINGGLHGAGNLDFQEFQVIPATTIPYSKGLEMGTTVYHLLRLGLERRGAIHSVGDEGGFAPNLFTNIDALTIIIETIKEQNLTMGKDIFLGLDVAATTFYKDGKYQIKDRSSPLDREAFITFFENLNEQFHLGILEDPLFEDDWEGWRQLFATFSGKVTIVGDDLLVTNPKRVKRGVEERSCDGVLVKLNQIGTVSETLEVIGMAKRAGWKIIISHRSGETNDAIVADFSVGVGADYVKFGAPARGERVAKYNRLLAIEKEIIYASHN